MRRPHGDCRHRKRQCREDEEEQNDEQPAQEIDHSTVTRAGFFIGRILAALGALLIVAVVILTWVSFATVDDCSEPDCDDVRFSDAVGRAAVLMPISILVGAAGVALVNDTYRKL